MSDSRPAIPEPIKREVRQRAHFGCVICGMPVFHYDHVEEWSVVKEHTVDNITLLCEMHHGAKTSGKLSVERVREAQKEPFNEGRRHTAPYQLEPDRHVSLMFGTNYAHATPSGEGEWVHHVLWVSGQTFFALHSFQGWTTVSFALTDTAGNLALLVHRGEMIATTAAWDYRYEGTNLQVRLGPGQILLDLDLANDHVTVRKGCFINKHGDGFAVEGDFLMTVHQGEPRSFFTGSGAGNNGFGAWGMNNAEHFPPDQCPGGFGFFAGDLARRIVPNHGYDDVTVTLDGTDIGAFD